MPVIAAQALAAADALVGVDHDLDRSALDAAGQNHHVVGYIISARELGLAAGHDLTSADQPGMLRADLGFAQRLWHDLPPAEYLCDEVVNHLPGIGELPQSLPETGRVGGQLLPQPIKRPRPVLPPCPGHP